MSETNDAPMDHAPVSITGMTALTVAVKRIAPESGKVVNLYGVREIVWDETYGLRVEFCPTGGPGTPHLEGMSFRVKECF